MSGTKDSCQCDSCKRACENKPGWFLPGEAEKAAKHLGIPLTEFFKTKLAVDWWDGSDLIFLLAPALVGEPSGSEYPGNRRGTCIFYKKGKCEIHAVKPFECREYIHDEPTNGRHQSVADAWKVHQAQIRKLLKHEPRSSPYFNSWMDM